MANEEKDLTQKFDDWIKKSPDIMALKWLSGQIDELREKLKEKIWIIQDDRMTDFGIKLVELSQKSKDINIFMRVQGIAINSHENEIRKIKEEFEIWKTEDYTEKENAKEITTIKEELSEIYTGSSLLQKELDIRVDILKTKMKVFRIDKIEKILYDIGKEVMDPEYFDKLIKGYVEIDLDDAQAIGYEKGINKGKKLQKQFDISQIIKKLGYLVKDCDGHSKEHYHNKLIKLKEEYQEMTITKKPKQKVEDCTECEGAFAWELDGTIDCDKRCEDLGSNLAKKIKEEYEKGLKESKWIEYPPRENETRIIDCMTNDEFEIQLNNIRNTRLGTAMSSLKGCILRERRLSKKETISKVVEKIESMRVKFADATKNYTTMDLMNELWEYKRELEKKLE